LSGLALLNFLPHRRRRRGEGHRIPESYAATARPLAARGDQGLEAGGRYEESAGGFGIVKLSHGSGGKGGVVV